MIKIIASPTPDCLGQYNRLEKPSLMPFYICINSYNYPDDRWTDFGAVVLVWWAEAYKELYSGQPEIVFRFMDGPYYLTLRTAQNPDAVDVYDDQSRYLGQTTQHAIRAAILGAIAVVSQAHHSTGVDSTNARLLNKCAVELRQLGCADDLFESGHDEG